jgi:hypothetical protein
MTDRQFDKPFDASGIPRANSWDLRFCGNCPNGHLIFFDCEDRPIAHAHIHSRAGARRGAADRGHRPEFQGDRTVTELGTCCGCETREDVINIIMLNRRAPVPGKGWGCVTCGLPSDGAVAVLCNACAERYQHDETALRFVCLGYASSGKRFPIDQLPLGRFDHDMSVLH